MDGNNKVDAAAAETVRRAREKIENWSWQRAVATKLAGALAEYLMESERMGAPKLKKAVEDALDMCFSYGTDRAARISRVRLELSSAEGGAT